ncbi:MAG: hypothetical protein IJ724_11200, partial [Muribaculaceae bacterium]|nr:hypothetical protein [Muribaculaceae bacterium]
MAKPTLQEINEAISTLASAGMLLNSEQTIAINRVRSEIKQQSEEYARAAEAKHQQEQEAQRRAEEARRLSKERKLANSHTDEQNELQEYETIPVDGLWQIFKQPWLHKAFKDRMCQCGMEESILSPQITHMQYKIKKIESNKSYNSLVNNCSTISDLRKLINTFLREWGD